MYKNQIQRLNESRAAYKRLFREDEMEYGTNTKGEADIIDCSDRAVSKQFLDILGNKKNYQPRTTEEVVKAYENFYPRIPPQVTKELRSVEEVIDYSGIGGGGGTPGPQAIVLWIIGGITVGLCGWMGYEWSQLPRGGGGGGNDDGGGGSSGGGGATGNWD